MGRGFGSDTLPVLGFNLIERILWRWTSVIVKITELKNKSVHSVAAYSLH